MLAIGIVVDDAIVVVEAVHAKMEKDGLSPWEAAKAAIGEIGGAVMAITLVMVAVFVPVTFLSGPVGIFFRQFAVTMAVAILISALNALTLSPALCALILKNTHIHDGHSTPEKPNAARDSLTASLPVSTPAMNCWRAAMGDCWGGWSIGGS